MVPIYEQGVGRGIRYERKQFVARFEEICAQHVRAGRAHSFAFIFYDFKDAGIRAVIDDVGVFAQLDRLAGRDLTIFYLHTAGRQATWKFNLVMQERLQLGDIELPCVVFFKQRGGTFTDFAVAQLDSPNVIHAFPELYKVIESFLSAGSKAVSRRGCQHVCWILSSLRFIAVEAVKDVLQSVVENSI